MVGFQPIVPMSGFTGWRFLERTVESQQQAFNNSAQIQRDIQYFKENVSNATTAEDLVKDHRLLSVALGAFGLDDDIDKKAYVLKALAEGTEDDKAFANRLVDKRYHEMVEAFGYGNEFGPRVGLSNFSESIISSYKTRQFEIAVGNSDESMRLAMTFSREISGFANSSNSNAAWFEIMGNPPMRKIFETAFGLPSSFGSLDIDRQRATFQEMSGKMFGSEGTDVFKDEANVERLLRTFFVRKQLTEGPGAGVRGTAALSLLRNTASGMASLFQSRL